MMLTCDGFERTSLIAAAICSRGLLCQSDNDATSSSHFFWGSLEFVCMDEAMIKRASSEDLDAKVIQTV